MNLCLYVSEGISLLLIFLWCNGKEGYVTKYDFSGEEEASLGVCLTHYFIMSPNGKYCDLAV
jgi:hypothetical protein